jgi:hypothetical protein
MPGSRRSSTPEAPQSGALGSRFVERRAERASCYDKNGCPAHALTAVIRHDRLEAS